MTDTENIVWRASTDIDVSVQFSRIQDHLSQLAHLVCGKILTLGDALPSTVRNKPQHAQPFYTPASGFFYKRREMPEIAVHCDEMNFRRHACLQRILECKYGCRKTPVSGNRVVHLRLG
jgi:hypothetical protein